MKRRGAVASVALLAPVACATMIASGLREAVAPPIERRAAFHMPGWPAGYPPVRIALLSDIHIGNRAMTAERLNRIVTTVDAARPDLVLIAGDFVNGRKAAGVTASAAMLVRPLSRLHAPLGVVAVLGNHDYWTAPAAVRSALFEAGATVLENQAIRRGPLTVIGIADAFSGHDEVAGALASARPFGGARVVLTHAPDLVPKLPGGLSLVLAGHTHCGQIVLPLVGPLIRYSPSEHWKAPYDPRYRCGIIHDPARTVIVTAGLGTGTKPIRIGAPPDWWLITLGA